MVQALLLAELVGESPQNVRLRTLVVLRRQFKAALEAG